MEKAIEAVKIKILKIINERIANSNSRKISRVPMVISDLVDFDITGLESNEEIETIGRDAYDEIVFDSQSCTISYDEEDETVSRELN